MRGHIYSVATGKTEQLSRPAKTPDIPTAHCAESRLAPASLLPLICTSHRLHQRYQSFKSLARSCLFLSRRW